MKTFDSIDPAWVETTDEEDFADRREWIAVDGTALNGFRIVSMTRIHAWRDGQIRTDPESGLSFDLAHLDAVIDALQRVRSTLSESEAKNE